jgi:hypothetical protein
MFKDSENKETSFDVKELRDEKTDDLGMSVTFSRHFRGISNGIFT